MIQTAYASDEGGGDDDERSGWKKFWDSIGDFFDNAVDAAEAVYEWIAEAAETSEGIYDDIRTKPFKDGSSFQFTPSKKGGELTWTF